MAATAEIQAFVSKPAFAMVGVSRSGNKFSNAAYRELKSKGYRVFAVNSGGGSFDGDPIYTSLAALPETVDAAVILVSPDHALTALQDCASSGVRNVWLQQGVQSPEALAFCREHELNAVSGECILMYAGASKFHGFHRFFRDLFRARN